MVCVAAFVFSLCIGNFCSVMEVLFIHGIAPASYFGEAQSLCFYAMDFVPVYAAWIFCSEIMQRLCISKKIFSMLFLKKIMMNKLSFICLFRKLRNVLLFQGIFDCSVFPYLRFRSDVLKIHYTSEYVWFLKKEARKREENSVV